MRRIVKWVLFQTFLGDLLLGLAERVLGLGIVPIESIDVDDTATSLLESVPV